MYAPRPLLQRRYRDQLKRRAQQVQEELVSPRSRHYVNHAIRPAHLIPLKHCVPQEFDHRILVRLLSEEQDGMRAGSEPRERVVADAAWMKRVIEEQLRLEREREAEFDTLHR